MNVVAFRSVDRVIDEFGDLSVQREPKQRYSPPELKERVGGADGLFVHSENDYTEELFNTTPNLRAIGKAGSGIDNINIDAATEHDIAVLHTPGMNGVAVAEFTVGAIVSLARRFHAAENHLLDGGWRSEAWWGTELRGKTVGIVGLGAAGYETARRLKPFDVDFLVADPYVSQERINNINGTRVSLKELLSNTDIVSLHVRLTEETEGMIDDDAFELLDDNVLLVNTSRGAVIDWVALQNALETNAIGGAVLDVFHEEPPDPASSILNHENVVATPHLAGATVQTRERMLVATARNVRRVLEGQSVDEEYLANPEVFKE